MQHARARLLLVSSMVAVATVAHADTSNSTYKATALTASNVQSCHRWDRYQPRDSVDSLSQPPCATLLPGIVGLRDVLAEHGWGIQGTISGDYAYDVLGHNRNPQTYNGQDPTWKPRTIWKLTYDLTRLGWGGDAQFIAGGTWQGGQYPTVRPNYAAMTTFAINQRFYAGRLTLQYGYYQLLNEYYGNVLGGNSATSAQGPGAILPSQVGVTQFEAVPAFTLTGKDASQRWYTEFTLARSGNPRGYIRGLKDNPSGFKLKVHGANPMFIDETGYKRSAGVHQHALWVRLGGVYNTSHYRYWKGGHSHGNHAVYVGYTGQLTQPDGHSRRGLYLDAKSTYIPQDRNAYGGDVQLTSFYIGPFASRPYDMAALGVSRSFFSKDHRQVSEARGIAAEHSTTGVTASYAARVIRGIYLNNSLTWQQNPAFSPQQKDALIYLAALVLSF